MSETPGPLHDEQCESGIGDDYCECHIRTRDRRGPSSWRSRNAQVVAYHQTQPDIERGAGEVIGYCDEPQVLIRSDHGQFWWPARLCTEVEVPCAHVEPDVPWKLRPPFACSLGLGHSGGHVAIVDGRTVTSWPNYGED
jgi:hypothetical protein